MNITIFILCYNETILIPHTIDHYRKYLPNAKIIILDNESTDKSVEIAKSLDCEIISWKSPRFNGIDDHHYKELKNNCWKEVKDGWIIVCDMDEWLCVTEKQLENELNNEVSILSVLGINIIGDSKNKDLSDINLHNLDKYVFKPEENKSLCFLREKINDMNYDLGCHVCYPNGNINFSSTKYINKHMELLGEPFYVNKFVERTKRAREQWAVEPHLAMHYTDDINSLKNNFKNNIENAMTIDKDMLTMMEIQLDK